MRSLRIAHLSDLHLLDLAGAVPFRLFNKRLTGYVNVRFKRGAVHKAFAVRAAARQIRRLGIDHVVVTGDLTNLALQTEFELVARILRDELAMPADRVSVVPGNHDVYTRGAFRAARFESYLAPYITSDLPAVSAGAAFPFVRLRGPVAIIGLSTAAPRLPLVASGVLGRRQLAALETALAHPEVSSRFPLLLQHHPWHNPPSRAKAMLEGLDDAPEQGRILESLRAGLLVHGHLHRRIHRVLPGVAGLFAVGTASASLLHDSDERMSGFNVYEIDDNGLASVTSHRLVPGAHDDAHTFREVAIPRQLQH